jgi:hypothetical protein
MFANANEKKSKSPVFLIAVSVFCAAVIGFFVLTDGGSSSGSSKVNRMQEMTGKVRGMESQVKQKQGEVMTLVNKYRKKTGATTPLAISTMGLSREERKLLQQQIDNEKDVSIRSLLQQILKKRDEIGELKEKIAEIEDRLPAPHVAKKGENHYTVALSFLVEKKGVPKKKAVKILARTALFEELAEGFKVWNFYAGGEYGTSVTQGTAKVSPNAFMYRAKKKLMDARDKALSERDHLAENYKSLEQEQEKVIGQLVQVNNEKEGLIGKVNRLNKQINSMFYRLDSQKNLKKEGIIKDGLLAAARLKDVSPGNFDKSLDLDADDRLVISAADLGVEKIKNVVLYPRFYKKGDSYKVLITPNKKHALLTLVDKTKFKSERVVIAVR